MGLCGERNRDAVVVHPNMDNVLQGKSPITVHSGTDTDSIPNIETELVHQRNTLT